MEFGNLTINEGIVETRLGRDGRQSRKEDALKARPIDRSQTHGAGFARSIEFTVLEFETPEHSACLPNSHHFSMSRGVVAGSYPVHAFSDDAALADNHRSEGTA